MTAPLFITGTGEAVGKTIVTLGLVSEMVNNHDGVGFIKPLGIARVRAGNEGIDMDAMLIEKACAIHENIKDMCPVTLSESSWPEVRQEDSEKMLKVMKNAYDKIAKDRQLMVVEGTGHAALGGGLGVSNARIAEMFGCRAVLVAKYGVMGRNPFDQAALNAYGYRKRGVEVIGLVINRVPPEDLESYREYATRRLEPLGVQLLGLIPEEPRFNTFKFLEISQILDGQFLISGTEAENVIRTVRVGAMTPHRAVQYLNPGSLIITPGDREDMIMSICACSARPGGGPAGLVLSGGQEPHPKLVTLLKEFNIPTYLAREDSFTVASKIHDMPVRIQPTDEEKIAIAQELVMKHVDLESLVSALKV